MIVTRDYLAGLIEGEGCFGIYHGSKSNILKNGEKATYPYYKPMFKLELRKDDEIIIEEIIHTLDIKNNIVKNDRSKTSYKFHNWKPSSVLQLYNKKDLYKLIDFLGVNPFIGKKKQQYNIWKEAVFYFNKTKRKTQRRKEERNIVLNRLKEYHDQLKEFKKYNGG